MKATVNRRIVLASGSPRRKELLEKIGLEFEVVKSDFDESSVSIKCPKKLVAKLADCKAEEVSHTDSVDSNTLIISADTVVVYKGEILGKPKDELDAMRMLKLLNGKKHQVYTAMCLLDMKTMTKKVSVVKTNVYFDNSSDETIMEYIKTGEPMDKAGAYGIQDGGSVLVKKINGDYFAVMGLSVNKLFTELKKIK